jgi:hypothetical protein
MGKSSTSDRGAKRIQCELLCLLVNCGGTGFAIDIQGYKHTYFNSELYFAGVYLFNPRDTNGVSTFRRAPGEHVMSVTGQYLYRVGIGHAVPKVRGLAVSIGGRMEGLAVIPDPIREDLWRASIELPA